MLDQNKSFLTSHYSSPLNRLHCNIFQKIDLSLLMAVVFSLICKSSFALDNGVSRTPPMGWNSWNTFGCNINETLIKEMADAIVNSGMSAAGYEYVVVDDCWFNPDRDESGNLRGNPARFPSGMKALGDYLHSKGLKFGIYQVPVDKTCAQYFNSYRGATGSLGHEEQDARQFAAWGVDFLKYDWCSPGGTINDQITAFAKMRDALAATGRPIVYSINPNSIHEKTGPQRNWSDVANMWRTTEDITNQWNTGQINGYPMGIKNIIDVMAPIAAYVAPGGFNDGDMMEVGRGGMTDEEMRTHFAMWSILNSPLIAGNDIRAMSASTLELLSNSHLIAINQDPLGTQAVQIYNDGTRRIFAKNLANGDVAVALYNQGSSTTTISIEAAAIGKLGDSLTLLNVWDGNVTNTNGTISSRVPAHGTVVLRVSGGEKIPGVSLVSASASLCVDLPESATDNGSKLVVWSCTGEPNQRWSSQRDTLKILGKCLDAPVGADIGTQVQIWDCNGSDRQKWTHRDDGTIMNTFTGLCLDVYNDDKVNGTQVILWHCANVHNRRWSKL